jgi:cytidylate kinase
VIVAIDGPAGAGKSSVARTVALRLGFSYLDTGAMYRAVALACLEHGLGPDDPEAVEKLARDLDIRIDGDRVFIGPRDVAERIRAPEVTAVVSDISALPGVRAALASHQRRMAESQDVVMEGRDIGTVVFPDADLKIFLTASADERARRRARQEGHGEDESTLARIQDSIERRDRADESRAQSPLVRASDAVLLDSTELTFEEVAEAIVALVKERAGS